MSALVESITKQASILSDAENHLKVAIGRYNTVKGLDGQQGYKVTINGVTVEVAEMDRHYYPKLIRGREMIHLGALKALDAEIDHWRARVKVEAGMLALCAERLAKFAKGEA